MYYVSSFPSPQHCQAYCPSRWLTGLSKWAGAMSVGLGSVPPAAVCAQGPKTLGRISPLLPVPFQTPGIPFDFRFKLLPIFFPRARALSQAIATVEGKMQWLLRVLAEGSTKAGAGVSSHRAYRPV